MLIIIYFLNENLISMWMDPEAFPFIMRNVSLFFLKIVDQSDRNFQQTYRSGKRLLPAPSEIHGIKVQNLKKGEMTGKIPKQKVRIRRKKKVSKIFISFQEWQKARIEGGQELRKKSTKKKRKNKLRKK